jgi:hypothetical protein
MNTSLPIRLLSLFTCCVFSQACKRQTTPGAERGAASGREIVTIRSANEPKTDADALALVGITMTPAPAVDYRHFTAGMDDHLDLVIRFPKSRLAEFWTSSKWKEKDSQALKTAAPFERSVLERRIQHIGTGKKEPILEFLRKSKDGIWCETPTGHHGGLRAFLSLDQDSENVVAYIEWFEI